MNVRGQVKLSELDDETIVYREDFPVITAGELKERVRDGEKYGAAVWVVGIPAEWKPSARSMLEDYIENASVDMYEDADEAMWDQVEPLVEQIQTLLDGVSVPYYNPGADIEIDIPSEGEPDERA